MSKRAELIEKYADDLKKKCKVEADMDLLTKVTIGCGPSIYNADACKVSSSDKTELERVKANFLAKKLGVTDEAVQDSALEYAIDTYGKSNSSKFRAVFYYLLVTHLKKESVYQ